MAGLGLGCRLAPAGVRRRRLGGALGRGLLGSLGLLLLALRESLEAGGDLAVDPCDLVLRRGALVHDVVGPEEGLLTTLEADAHLPLLDVGVDHVLVERRGVFERLLDPLRELEGLGLLVERDLLVAGDDGDGDLGDAAVGLVGSVDDLARDVAVPTHAVLELRVGEATGEAVGAGNGGVTHGDSFQKRDRMSNWY